MKVFVSIFAFLNGSYMLVDGIYVLLKHKYIGPDKPGPWANLFYKLNMDVFKLGPLFIIFGLLWLCWLISLWTRQSFSYTYGVVIAIATLWYLPLGTLFSLIILVMLLFAKQRIAS